MIRSAAMRARCFLPLLLLLASSSARGDEKAAPPSLSQAAQDHYTRAEQFYVAGEYRAAGVEFEAGYKLSGNAVFLWNLAKTAAKLGQRAEALDYLLKFRASQPGPDPEADRLQAELQGPAPAPATTAVTIPDKPRPQPRVRPVVIAGFSVGTAFLATSLGLTIAGSLAKSDLEGRPVTLDELEAGRRAAVGYQAATITLAVSGSIILIASGVAHAKLRGR